ELLEHATQGLFRNVEDIEQVGDLHAGIAVDEMQHAMVRTPKAQLQQHFVWVTDEVAVGEEQKLDDVPDGLDWLASRWSAISQTSAGNRGLVHIYVSHVDIFCFYVTKPPSKTKGSCQKDPFWLTTLSRQRVSLFSRSSHTGCCRPRQSVGIDAKNTPSRR